MTDTSSPIVAMLPDTADSRLLVDLTSHATDISEAAHSIGLALQAGEGSELWGPLTMHAVTAYVRPFIHSNVRPRLDEMPGFVGIPSHLRAVHKTIRTYRNTTVAHSQSDLAMPIALALLNARGTVKNVVGITLLQPMPTVVAERMVELIDTVETILDDLTQPVIDRLREQLRDVPAETIAVWKTPEMLAKLDIEFSGAQRRTRHPRFTGYWRVEGPISVEAPTSNPATGPDPER